MNIAIEIGIVIALYLVIIFLIFLLIEHIKNFWDSY